MKNKCLLFLVAILPFGAFGTLSYDSAGLWDSWDIHAADYAMWSPWMYCGGNPIRFVDPTGMDERDLNSNGEIINHIETDEHDAFFIVDDENKRIENKSLVLKNKTVIKAYSKKDDSGVDYDTYKTRGDEESTELFEFLAQNTSVEWSQAKTGVEGEQGLNFITSSHMNGNEYGMGDLVKNQLSGGYTVRTINHSHPNNESYPSGLYSPKGDISFSGWAESILRQKISFNIFLPKSVKYVSFNQYSIPKDFGLESKATQLDGIIVVAKHRPK